MDKPDTTVDPLAAEKDHYWDEVSAKYGEDAKEKALEWYTLYRNKTIGALELCFLLGSQMTPDECFRKIYACETLREALMRDQGLAGGLCDGVSAPQWL